MEFLKKRWVSIIISLAMIVAAIVIIGMKNRQISYEPDHNNEAQVWAEQYYSSYTRFISDIGGRLTEETKDRIAVINAIMDYSYNGICSVAVVKSVGDMSMEDAARNLSSELLLGDYDSLLLLDVTAKDWYLFSGTDFTQYVDDELDKLLETHTSALWEDLNKKLPILYDNLLIWYQNHVPLSNQEKISADTASSSASFFTVIIILLAVIMMMTSASRMKRKTSRRWAPTVVVTGRKNRTIRYDLEPDENYLLGSEIYRRNPNSGSYGRRKFDAK